MTTLLRATGAWVHPTERAREYGLAVLRVAANLGDERAALILETGVLQKSEPE